ncbi:MAG: PAS domain S-box protein [Gaiellaceae bacterium]
MTGAARRRTSRPRPGKRQGPPPGDAPSFPVAAGDDVVRLARLFFGSARMPFAILAPDLSFLMVNRAMCELVDRPEEDLVGSPGSSIFPTEESGPTGAVEQVLEAPDGTVSRDRRLRRGGGGTIWARLQTTVAREPGGEILCYVGTAQDITNEKSVLEKLDRERDELAEAEAIAEIGSWRWNTATQEFFCSDQMRRIFEVAPGALGPEPFLDRLPASDRGWIKDRLLRAAQDGLPCDFVHRIARPGGGSGIAHTRVRSAAYEDQRWLVGTTQDITELREAEQAAAEATERFVTAFEDAPIGMSIVSTEGTYLQVNPALCSMLGYTAEQLLGRDIATLTHPEDVESSVLELRQLALGEKETTRYEKRFLHADGRTVWAMVASSVVRDDAGKPLYLVAQVEDISERKAAERALTEANARFVSAFENAPIGMAIVSLEGAYLQVNEALCRILGYTREQLLETTFQALTHADDSEADARYMRGLLAGEFSSRTFEKRYIHADGHVVWARLASSLVRDGQGRPLYFVTQVEDVSERKQAERSAAEAGERFRGAFENAPIGMALARPDGTWLQVNPALCSMLGYQHEELLATTFVAVTHPDDRESSIEQMQRLLDGRSSSSQFEKRYLHADGHDVWVILSTSLVRDAEGEPLYFVTQMVDVSERRLLEELLRRNAATLEEAQRIAAVGSYEWSLATGEVTWSRELYEIHGVDPATFAPSLERSLELVHSEDRGVFPHALIDELAARGSMQARYRIVKPDGSVRHVVANATSQRDEDGKVLRVTGVVQDVTERVEAEEARLELEARMQEAQRLESLGVLAGGIAHDFNNLLVGVLGNAGLAALELPPSSPAKLLIDQIELAARRAAELTKQMLAYSGRGQFVVQPLDLRDVVRETSALVESGISKNVTIAYELAGELPAVRADVAQMRQLIMNLITNAADAIGEAVGRIEISVGRCEADAAHLAGYALSEGLPEGTYVWLEVVDSGVGMDAETLARIFDPFFTTKFSGHGLGLAAALGIVRGHHGAIRVESEPGRGSSFRLLLPAVDDPAEKPGSVSVKETWTGSGTIMVVDDEEIVRRAARRILSSGGLNAVEATSGEEALRLFTATPDGFDAALVDLVMPGIGGEELVRALHELRPGLPVVLTSGYDARPVVEALGGESARVDFLQKPYHPRDLLECMRKRLAPG